MDCVRVREELELRLEHGAGMAELESELVERGAELSEDERAALWLFAWACPSGRHDAAERVMSPTG